MTAESFSLFSFSLSLFLSLSFCCTFIYPFKCGEPRILFLASGEFYDPPRYIYALSRSTIYITGNAYDTSTTLQFINYRWFKIINIFSALSSSLPAPSDFRIPFASSILRKTNTSLRIHAPTKRLCPVERYWDVRPIYRRICHSRIGARSRLGGHSSIIARREGERERQSARRTGVEGLQPSLICDDNGRSISDTGDDFPLPIARPWHIRGRVEIVKFESATGDDPYRAGKFLKLL